MRSLFRALTTGLMLLTASAAADPWFTGPLFTVPATQPQVPSTVGGAYGAGNYLLVWSQPGNSLDVHGALVSPAAFMAAAPFVVSNADGGQELPSAAFVGTHFNVVWNDLRDPSSVNIYGARVALDGGALDPAGIPISVAPSAQKYIPNVACHPLECLVVWSERFPDWNITGARVGLDLAARSGDVFVVNSPSGQFQPRLVAVDGGYVLAFTDDRVALNAYGIYVARLDLDGGSLDGPGFAASSTLTTDAYERAPLADDGTRRWLTMPALQDGGVIIFGAVNPPFGLADSTVLRPPTGMKLGTSTLTFDGTHLWLAYEVLAADGGASIYGRRVFVDGGFNDPAPTLMIPNAQAPYLLSDRSGTVLLAGVSVNGPLVYQVFRTSLLTDAGVEPDGGVDAGLDAGTDGGVDAGLDAGTDAGISPRTLTVGSHCASAGSTPMILLAALAWATRRRRVEARAKLDARIPSSTKRSRSSEAFAPT